MLQIKSGSIDYYPSVDTCYVLSAQLMKCRLTARRVKFLLGFTVNELSKVATEERSLREITL